MKKTKIVIVALALCVALLSCALGAILIQKQISSSVHLLAVGNFVMTKEDLTTPVTSINFGSVYPGNSSNSHDVLGSYIVLQAQGSIALKFTWTAVGLDRTQWNITCTWNGANNQPFLENSYQFSIAPPGTNGWLAFTLTSLNTTNIVEQDVTFSIAITATQA